MGFSTFATTAAAAAASAIPRILEARAYKRESKNLNQMATIQENMAAEQSETMINTALRNARAESRNANDDLSRAYADAGASNLVEDGSAVVRERDLATRLQDDINLRADSALQEAQNVRKQGALDAWNTRMSAQRARSMARGSLISGVGSLIGGLGSGLMSSAGGSGSSAGQA